MNKCQSALCYAKSISHQRENAKHSPAVNFTYGQSPSYLSALQFKSPKFSPNRRNWPDN